MGSYFTHFGDQTVDVAPSGWTERWDVAGPVAWTVRASPTALAGKALEVVGPDSTGGSALTWDAIDSDGDRADVELYARLRILEFTHASLSGFLALTGRLVASPGMPQDAYEGRALSTSGALDDVVADVAKHVAGGSVQPPDDVDGSLAVVMDPYTVGEWFRARFRVVGDLLFLRLWADGTAEPAAWTVEGVDNDITAAGLVGFRWFWGAKWEIDWIAVETGGGTAVPDFVDAGVIALIGTGSLTTTASVTVTGRAALRGVGHSEGYWEEEYADLDYVFGGLVRPLLRRASGAALSGVGALVVSARRHAVTTMALVGTGLLELQPVRRINARKSLTPEAAALVGTGTLTLSLTVKKFYLKTLAILRQILFSAPIEDSTHTAVIAPSTTAVVWRQTVPFTIKKGDTKPVLAATLQEANGDPIDLTGATVRIIIVPSAGGAPKVNSAATIVDAPNGGVEYDFFAGDTDTAGDFQVEFEITFASVVVGPATTISFDASDDSINDSGSGLGVFSVGQTLAIAGSASNDGQAKVLSVTAGKLVVSDKTIVTEVAGASVTLTHSGHKLTCPNGVKGEELKVTDELGSAP